MLLDSEISPEIQEEIDRNYQEHHDRVNRTPTSLQIGKTGVIFAGLVTAIILLDDTGKINLSSSLEGIRDYKAPQSITAGLNQG